MRRGRSLQSLARLRGSGSRPCALTEVRRKRTSKTSRVHKAHSLLASSRCKCRCGESHTPSHALEEPSTVFASLNRVTTVFDIHHSRYRLTELTLTVRPVQTFCDLLRYRRCGQAPTEEVPFTTNVGSDVRDFLVAVESARSVPSSDPFSVLRALILPHSLGELTRASAVRPSRLACPSSLCLLFSPSILSTPISSSERHVATTGGREPGNRED
jgi:hypothetical protein